MKEWTEVITLVATLLTGGWAATVLTQIVKRPGWPSYLKEVTAIIAAVLVGLATAWLSGDITTLVNSWGNLTAAELLAVMGIVYTAAKAWYVLLIGNAGWMGTLGTK